MPQPARHAESHPHQRQALRAVALIEFVKGIFVLLMGICALLLLRQDLWVVAESLLALLHINPDRHYAQIFLDYADNITDARLWAAARIAFAYSILRFVEAYGLWKARAWGEWIACISGTLLLPLEIRELLHKVTWLRVAVFVGNVAIVLFMAYVIRARQQERRKHASVQSAESRAAGGE